MAERNGIRPAKLSDHLAIQGLLTQLGYPDTAPFLEKKLELLLPDPDEALLVYEHDHQIAAFVAIHFFRQLGLEGDFARITYFAVSDDTRGRGIGSEMEDCITELARARNCDRVEVHCHSRRTDAHRFYLRQGYEESPKYFIKVLSQDTELGNTQMSRNFE